MKILIVGAGKVGSTIAAGLSREDHDITLMDNDLSALERDQDNLNVMSIKGSGTSMNSLMEAGVDKTDLLIAVTNSDEVNMLCCMTAKRLGAKHTVARIRDPEYSRELYELKKDLDLDMVINPEYQTAMEIARILRFSAAASVETFAGGHVEMVSYRVSADEKVVGKPLSKVMQKTANPVLYCAVMRGNELIIPNGDTVLQEGDLAYLVGRGTQIANFLKTSGRRTSSARNVVVIGGGLIAYYLCDSIMKSGVRVRIVDENKEICEEMDARLPGCVVIRGDGTSTDLLEAENVRECDALVMLTGSDEENVITGLYGRQIGVPKVVVKVNRNGYMGVLKELKMDSTVSPKNITATQIIRYVRALNNSQGTEGVEMLYRFAGGQLEASQFSVTETTRYRGVPLKDIRFRAGVLLAAINRRGEVLIPSGKDVFREQDTVIVISRETGLKELNEIFQ